MSVQAPGTFTRDFSSLDRNRQGPAFLRFAKQYRDVLFRRLRKRFGKKVTDDLILLGIDEAVSYCFGRIQLRTFFPGARVPREAAKAYLQKYAYRRVLDQLRRHSNTLPTGGKNQEQLESLAGEVTSELFNSIEAELREEFFRYLRFERDCTPKEIKIWTTSLPLLKNDRLPPGERDRIAQDCDTTPSNVSKTLTKIKHLGKDFLANHDEGGP
jgi:hypothetical protein